VLDRSVHLLPLCSTDDLASTCVDRDQAYLAHGTVTWARQEDGYNPEIALAHEPLRILSEAAERVMAAM
jgi:hypothetical protein